VIVAADPAFRTRHANPYNALLYDAVEARDVEVREFVARDLLVRRPDIVHLHWPELTFLSSHRAWQSRARIATFAVLIALARLRGTRLVWTLHNDGAHEHGDSALQRALDRMLARNLDGVFTLSEAGEIAFHARFGDRVPVFRTPHGHYREAYPLTVPRAAARAELGVDKDATLLAAVGQIRPYKNIPALIAAVAQLDDAGLRLGIAGRPDGPASSAHLLEAAQLDPRISLDLARLDDARMGAWLRAADAVVLPYRHILNSGSAILALSAGRPVIVPAVGAMPELASLVGEDWVYLYEGEFSPEVLRRALEWVRGTERPGAPDLSAFEWPAIAEATVGGYEAVLARKRRMG
jgi:glycosyltransferase involved in cell wall biosynthesis